MRPTPLLLSDRQLRNPLSTATKTIVEKLGRSVLDFLIPLRCPGCNKKGVWFCEGCLAKLQPVVKFKCPVCGQAALKGTTHPYCQTRYTLDRMISVYQFEGPIRKATHWLKYKDVTGLAKVLADLMVEEVGELGIEFGKETVVIPVPLHWWQAWKRGFNQAELLARPFGKSLGLEIRSDLLRRTRNTESQTKLKGEERQKNMRGAFAVPESKKKEVVGRDFLLLDDVRTTGATLNACANALKRAGAHYVWALTLAES